MTVLMERRLIEIIGWVSSCKTTATGATIVRNTVFRTIKKKIKMRGTYRINARYFSMM